MKAIVMILVLSVFNISQSLSSQILIQEDPEPKVPKRADSMSEEREIIEGTSRGTRNVIKKRHIRQNQEEIDPIFYDATVSPNEMKNSK